MAIRLMKYRSNPFWTPYRSRLADLTALGAPSSILELVRKSARKTDIRRDRQVGSSCHLWRPGMNGRTKAIICIYKNSRVRATIRSSRKDKVKVLHRGSQSSEVVFTRADLCGVKDIALERTVPRVQVTKQEIGYPELPHGRRKNDLVGR